MQTFLPYRSFTKSAQVLDRQRLGKQRVEGKQILNALSDPTNSWRNHVAVRMWQGHENALKHYTNIMISEWSKRGYFNSMQPYVVELPIVPPPWLDDPRLTLSHRCNLVRKLPEVYSLLWPEVDETAPYWWPVRLLNSLKNQEMINYWGE